MYYGALHDIEEQCNEKGYTLGNKKELVDKLHFGLNICHIHSVLTDSEYDRALARLNKLVGKYAKPISEEETET